MLSLPAGSIADLAYKLAVVADVWRQTSGIEEHGEYHERIAAAFFEDAHRLLLPMLPAVI